MKNIPVEGTVPSDKVDILMEQLQKLRQEERVLIGLYFYEELSIEEISDLLSIKAIRVKEMINQILPKLLLTGERQEKLNKSFLEAYGI
jgi:DNA-directed RNA polymerase specialized sigma subunit